MNDLPLTVGVDVGGTKILAAVVDPDGRVLARAQRATPARTTPPATVEDVLADVVDEVRSSYDVAAVGVGAAGFVDTRGERVRFAPHLAWRDEPLAERLAARWSLPVVLDNDANVALLAEHRHGAARGVDDVVLVALGTGIGGAILACGELYRGAGGMAGEFGHMQVVAGGLICECGRSGCWEQYCSGRAVARLAAAAGLDLVGADLTGAAVAGDPVARNAFAEVGRWLGAGLANVVAALDPALVVIGGGLSAAHDLLLGPARQELASVLVGAGHRDLPPVVPASLGPEAGVIGAADLARRAR